MDRRIIEWDKGEGLDGQEKRMGWIEGEKNGWIR